MKKVISKPVRHWNSLGQTGTDWPSALQSLGPWLGQPCTGWTRRSQSLPGGIWYGTASLPRPPSHPQGSKNCFIISTATDYVQCSQRRSATRRCNMMPAARIARVMPSSVVVMRQTSAGTAGARGEHAQGWDENVVRQRAEQGRAGKRARTRHSRRSIPPTMSRMIAAPSEIGVSACASTHASADSPSPRIVARGGRARAATAIVSMRLGSPPRARPGARCPPKAGCLRAVRTVGLSTRPRARRPASASSCESGLVPRLDEGHAIGRAFAHPGHRLC
jgi:hypothetical protein